MLRHMAFRIAPLASAADLADFAALLDAYVAGLGVDLAYQGWAAERAGLPGPYAPPLGAALLARGADGTPLGCVALRPLDAAGLPPSDAAPARPGIAEMKRLYVTPAARGTGLGRALAEAALAAARGAGHAELRLDTLPTMAEAQRLYRALGFTECPPYGNAALPGTLFLSRAP